MSAGETAQTGVGSLLKGVDVSAYQPGIDWKEVAKTGVRFAYVKATEGVTFQDPFLSRHANGAHDAGLLVGVYHFYRPNDSPAKQVDAFLLRHTSLSPILKLPPMLDLEVRGVETNQEYVSGIIAFVNEWKRQIEGPLCIYTYPSFWKALGNPHILVENPLWLADYGVAAPTLIGGWSSLFIWQYSSAGQVAGIPEEVDLDYGYPDHPLWQTITAQATTA